MKPATEKVQPIQVGEADAARRLGICEKTLFNRRKSGDIKFVRDGGRVLYRLDELERYSKSREVSAVAD